jgi:hypothetical protein
MMRKRKMIPRRKVSTVLRIEQSERSANFYIGTPSFEKKLTPVQKKNKNTIAYLKAAREAGVFNKSAKSEDG